MPTLTAKQLDQLRQILADASEALAVSIHGYQVSDDELQRLSDEGWLDPDNLDDITLDAITHGAMSSRTAEVREMSWDEFQRELKINPWTPGPAEKLAIETAQQQAGINCVGLGNRWSSELGKMVISADQEARTKEMIAEKTGEAISRRKTIGTLRSDFRQLTMDYGRDWDRIAHTELHNAHEEGYQEDVRARHGDEAMMAKVPDPGACEACRSLYLDADGKPAIHPMSWWDEQGATNIGRKKADWKAVTGTVHPWCRCATSRVPAGWGFTSDWELTPSPEDEEKALPVGDLVKAGEAGIQKARKLHYRTTFQGLKISVENQKGSIRRWYDPHNGEEGQTRMMYPYGYIRLTEGADGDHVDVYLGPNKEAENAYIVNQRKAPKFKELDEQKVMLGFDSEAEARKAYLAHYNDRRFLGDITAMPMAVFKEKVLKTRKAKNKLVKATYADLVKAGGYIWDRVYPNRSVNTGGGMVDGPGPPKPNSVGYALRANGVKQMVEQAVKNRENKRRQHITFDPRDVDPSVYSAWTGTKAGRELAAIPEYAKVDQVEVRHTKRNREHAEMEHERRLEAQDVARQVTWARPWSEPEGTK